MSVSISEVKEYLREKNNRERIHRQDLFKRAAKDFAGMVDHIKRNYGNIAIYQWGTAKNDRFSSGFC